MVRERAAVWSIVILLMVLCLGVQNAAAQGELVPLVTNHTPMGLSLDFGVPQTRAVNQNGDFAFSGEGGSAIFFQSHTAASGATPQLFLQYGAEIPGFPGSRVTSLNNVQLNDNGLVAFQANGSLADGQSVSIILGSYNGVTFQDLVDSTMNGGTTYGSFTLLGLDNAGDFAFLSNGTNGVIGANLYIAMSGNAPVLAAAVGQTAPGTGGGTFSGFILSGAPQAALAFNNSGQLFIASNISGAAGGTGLFVISTSGIRGVVANGNTNPLGGQFTISQTNVWGVFNNAGQVAFVAGGSLWINSPSTSSPATGTTTLVAAAGTTAPAVLGTGGTISFVLPATAASGFLALDDNGDIVAVATTSVFSGELPLLRFTATPAGSTTYTTKVVAYSGDTVPPGEVIDYIQNVSINNSGLVSFVAELTNPGVPGPGTIVGSILEETPSGAISNVIHDGANVMGLTGGGKFLLYSEDESKGLFDQVLETVTLNNGTLFFACDVVGGTADHGEFLLSGGNLQILMNTGQQLPAGANVAMSSPSGAGDYVAFIARYAGGQANLVVHNIETQATTVAAYEGEAATGTTATIKTINAFYINSNGHVAFGVGLTGEGTGHGGVFVGIPGSGITKIAAAGDIDSATGLTIFGPTLPANVNGWDGSPINDSDQVAFYGSELILDEIFVGAPGVAPVKVAVQGDSGLGGLELAETANIALNDGGFLAFVSVPPGTLTVTSGGTAPTPQGIFAAAPTGSTPPYSLSDILNTGYQFMGSTLFAALGYPTFNNMGSLALDATLTGGSSQAGIFVGNATTGYALALDGTPSPTGPNFIITGATIIPKINDQNDVTFSASISGGAGIFVRRGATSTAGNPPGVLTAPVVTGQPAPGSSGTFFGVGVPVLGQTGDVAFPGSYTTGGPSINGLWHIETNNAVEAIVVQGTVAAEFGGGTLVASAPGISWNSNSTTGGGQFPIYGVVSGGSFLDGIFLFEPGITTNTPAGTNVVVSPTDATTGANPVTLTFSGVTSAGTTSLTIASGGPTIPSAFALGNPPVFYDISTTAVFSGIVTVCINPADVNFPPGSTHLQLLHFQNGAWANVTGPGPAGMVCGQVTSFSPFAVASIAPCATDISSSVSVTRSGYSYSVVTKRYAQTITLTNTSNASIAGPISLVLDNLTSSATLLSPAGTTACAAPLGSLYVTYPGSLTSGASATLGLQFNDPTKAAFSYTTRVLAGSSNQ